MPTEAKRVVEFENFSTKLLGSTRLENIFSKELTFDNLPNTLQEGSLHLYR